MLKVSECDYEGWKSLKIENQKVELICPLEIGPRILSCRLNGQRNLFHNVAAELGGREEAHWCLRGGHRLWAAPEVQPETYELDNRAIRYSLTEKGNKLILEGNVDVRTGLQKNIELVAQGDSGFRINHQIVNRCTKPVYAAPWSLTVMEAGGYAALPLPPKESHESALQPRYSVVPWAYTDFSLPLWQMQSAFIGVDTLHRGPPQKIGLTDYPGWTAYWQEAGTFLKHSVVTKGADYPDRGCPVEIFSNDFMIELETLGQLKTLEPGHSLEHSEDWLLLADLPRFDSDERFAADLLPVVTTWLDTLQ